MGRCKIKLWLGINRATVEQRVNFVTAALGNATSLGTDEAVDIAWKNFQDYIKTAMVKYWSSYSKFVGRMQNQQSS